MKGFMLTGIFRLLCTLLLIATGVTGYPVDGAGAEILGVPKKKPVLNSTFFQLLDQSDRWNRHRLEKLFDSFQALGLKQVIIQWSLYDNKAFFVTKTFPQAQSTPLDTMLELAEKRGIELYLGLAAGSDYWDMTKQSHAYQEEYLNRLRWKSERVAQELVLIASRYTSFKGWYIPEEIDDSTWRPPQARKLMYQHLKKLTIFLKELTPSGTIILSGFSSARMNPDAYQEFWNTLLRETFVDTLLFQDGTGTAALPQELLPLYLKAVRQAADANKKKLQVVVELFTMVSESPFKAVPAPISRIKQQLLVADDFATDGINSFSVPDYMACEESAAAMELLRDYQKYKGGGQITTP
jgi:hypothetical protein